LANAESFWAMATSLRIKPECCRRNGGSLADLFKPAVDHHRGHRRPKKMTIVCAIPKNLRRPWAKEGKCTEREQGITELKSPRPSWRCKKKKTQPTLEGIQAASSNTGYSSRSPEREHMCESRWVIDGDIRIEWAEW